MSEVKITKLTVFQVRALENGAAAGYIAARITRSTATWHASINASAAIEQVERYQMDTGAKLGARGGDYQALHAVLRKLRAIVAEVPAPVVEPEPVVETPAEAPVEMYATPMASYKPAPRGLRVLAGVGNRQAPLTQSLNWTLELRAKTTEEARHKMEELLDPATPGAESYDWVAMQVGMKADWVTLDIRDKAHAFSSFDHQRQDAFAYLVKALGTVEGAEALLALMGCTLGEVEDWAAEHRRHYAHLVQHIKKVEPLKAETSATNVFVQVTHGVSAGELELFRKLAKDAGNWSGTPLLPLISPEEKAAFTNLKKRGLMGSFVDNSHVFATFTKAGATMANELYDIEIETTY